MTFFPDSYDYLATADHLSDTSSGRPLLFPLLLRITGMLHLKQSIVCYFIQILSLACFFWFCGPRKKLLSLTNIGILIGFLLLPAIWSYCGSCLTESILFAVEIWIVIFLSLLFFPRRQTSLASAILYSVAIGLLAILLKPWIMIYVIGCSVLIAVIAWFGKAFRSARRPALVLFIVTIGIFAFSYRYNMSKSSSSANIGYLLANSDKVDDLKARLQEVKDSTSEEARFISLIIDDIQLLKAKYNSDPCIAPMEELKVLKVYDKAYVDTLNKAFRIAYFERKKDVINLMGLSVERYVKDTKLGLSCLDVCYGPYIKILKKNGVYFAICFFLLTFIYWFIRKRRQTAPSFKRSLSANGKQLLIFVGVLLFTSIFFALFLAVSGGIELRRTVLPAVLFQLAAISYLIINRHELMMTKHDNT
ncbi:hypothetical protein [Niastella sp.]|uniref:hypothetical protein n=1 Tax=Niastella sp. TaxID=1869183 RepID=UPI00389AEF4E